MKKLLVIALMAAFVIGQYGSFHPHTFNQEDQVDMQALSHSIEYTKQAVNDDTLTFKGVESCKTQVVAGIKYLFVLNFVNSEDSAIQYEVLIYLRPWENYYEVLAFKQLLLSSSDNNKSADLEENSQLREEILTFVLQQLKMRVNADLTGYTISEYEVLGMQVVQGNIYDLKVVLQKDEVTKTFRVKVWSRPWIDPSLVVTEVSDYQEELTAGGFSKYTWDQNG